MDMLRPVVVILELWKSQHGFRYVNTRVEFQLVRDNTYQGGEQKQWSPKRGTHHIIARWRPFVWYRCRAGYKTARSIYLVSNFLTAIKFSMDSDLTHGRFRIISLTEGRRPTSISYGRPGSQLVRLGEPVDVV